MVPIVLNLAAAALAGLAAGAINTLAGGGTLVSFPVLLALGVAPVSANVTNTVALCPGYFGGAWAQRDDLRPRRRELVVLGSVSAAGGLLGGIILVSVSNEAFRWVAPWLILGACGLLLVQEPLRRRLAARRLGGHPGPARDAGAAAAVFPAAVYGGFFGAGLGVMLMAVLGIVLDEELPAVNAIKVALSLVVNVVAAAFFLFSGKIEWVYVAVLAPASLAGGHMAGRYVSRIKPTVLRLVVVAFGVAVSIRLFVG